MTTQTPKAAAPSQDFQSLLPHPYELKLSDESVLKLQKILERASGKPWTFEDTKQRGLELLRLMLLMIDPDGYARRIKELPVLNPELKANPPAPVRAPQAFPIPLQGYHRRDLELNLQMVAHELEFVKRRPTSWRWAIVALYDALGHALAASRPENFWPEESLGQLTALYDAVAAERPELPQVGDAVHFIDRLRTTFIADGVTRWPVNLKELPSIFESCLRVIRRLEPEAGVGCDACRGPSLSPVISGRS